MTADDFLKTKGILIENTNEYALNKKNALKFIKMLKNESRLILGGDVYIKQNGKLIPTYDNWYTDNDNIEQGYKVSNLYIENYNSDFENSIYFVMVFK